ncbi:hypothetical protein EDWATA_03833 [Edwardsiella tarda ATCC 23685]|uniref:Uncharacterized protein n=1 Tax=Edwardsiella tarda ATCC 23685 TaxID=500638 RepID=D4FAL4_EDWTA|nr:hypothetical protein EDWATA_03833 [Edwardsiella tarda ATCC 23685]
MNKGIAKRAARLIRLNFASVLVGVNITRNNLSINKQSVFLYKR